MKNILVNQNDGDPIYVALSNKSAFHIIYQGSPISSYQSIRAAVDNPPKHLGPVNPDKWFLVG